MAFSDFTLQTAMRAFGLSVDTSRDLFAQVPPVPVGAATATLLRENAPLALSVGTEKARSELLIMPILMEARRQAHYQISVFSGASFIVDTAQRLAGFCDYLVSASPESLYLEAPVLAVVEAKNEAIVSGYGQCIAEMVAAKIFNERAGTPRTVIYGAVTTGDAWSFLQLSGQSVVMEDGYYYLDRIENILGILLFMVRPNVLLENPEGRLAGTVTKHHE